MNKRTQNGEWIRYPSATPQSNEEPDLIYSVYLKNNTLFVGKEMFLFNKPGFCWDGENKQGKYQACIEKVLPHLTLTSGLKFDSVYVCQVSFLAGQSDSAEHRYYLSAPYKMMVRHEVFGSTQRLEPLEEVVRLEEK